MKHRLQQESTFARGSVRAAAGVLPMAIAVVCGGVAAAANPSPSGPSTADTHGSGAQPGVTVGPGVVTAAPDSPAVLDDQAAPTTDYASHRPPPTTRRYVAPLNVNSLHAPSAERPVAPIIAPPGTIRIGDAVVPASWLPAGIRDQVNGAAAGAEAQVSTFARSVGVSPGRSDRIAGAAAVGGLITSVPGALVGGALGGAAGAAVGLVLALGLDGALLIATLGPGLLAGFVADIPEVGLATAIGAVGGAAVGGAVTGLPGALIGGAVGSAL